MKKRKFNEGGIYTSDMGQPPFDPDGGSAPMKKPMPKPPMAMKKPMPKKPMPKKPMAPVKRPTAVDRSMDDMGGGRGAAPISGAMKKGGKVKMKRGGKC
jgi:hypothetical protein